MKIFKFSFNAILLAIISTVSALAQTYEVPPSSSTSSYVPYISDEAMEQCVILYNKAKWMANEIESAYVNQYSQASVNAYNDKITKHASMIDSFNRNCAGKQSESAYRAAQELNKRSRGIGAAKKPPSPQAALPAATVTPDDTSQREFTSSLSALANSSKLQDALKNAIPNYSGAPSVSRGLQQYAPAPKLESFEEFAARTAQQKAAQPESKDKNRDKNDKFLDETLNKVKVKCKKKEGIDYLNCWANYSPEKCKSFVYSEDRKAWSVCVYSCGSSGIYSRNFGECSN